MSSFNQRECKGCGQPCDGFYCYLCACQQCGVSLINEICLIFTYGDGKPVTCCGCEGPLNSGFVGFAIRELEIHSLMNQIRILSMILQTFSPTLHNPSTRLTCASYYSIDHQEDLNQQQINNAIEDKMKESHNELLNMVKLFFEHILWQREQAVNLSINITEPSRRLNSFCSDDDDDYDYEERTIPLNDIISQIPPSIVLTTSLPVLPIEDPEVSLIRGNEDLSTIPEKKSDEFIKTSVKNLVPIPSESEDTSESENVCILPLCDYFSPIDVPEEKAVTFSNPLFNSNDDFTSSDDESLSDEDVPEDNVKIYSNPLFEFDDEYISSDSLLFFDANKDECFDPGGDDDEINVLDCEDSYYDSEGYILYLESLLNDDLVHRDPSIHAMSVASILEGFTDEPPLEENDDLFDL
nr:hypothetical protein [Tanacetum cinerariifolium]